VLTDHAMPGMTGADTGASDQGGVARAADNHWRPATPTCRTVRSGLPRLSKPYPLQEELAAQIARVFEVRASGDNVVPIDTARRA